MKLYIAAELGAMVGSLPPRERGLKRFFHCGEYGEKLSLPPRERGLKLVSRAPLGASAPVAPSAGAWIETLSIGLGKLGKVCRSLRGSVD